MFQCLLLNESKFYLTRNTSQGSEIRQTHNTMTCWKIHGIEYPWEVALVVLRLRHQGGLT